MLNLYVAISAAIVAVAILVFALIFFTPIKKFVPGYGDASSGELREYNASLTELEEQVKAQEIYANSLRRMVTGDVESEADVEEVVDNTIDKLQSVSRIKEDDILRKEVEEDVKRQQKEMVQSVNASPKEVPLEQLYFMPPITGVVSESFMPDKKHFGTDVLAPKNTPVKAIMDGYVISADWTLETGNTIAIQHLSLIHI